MTIKEASEREKATPELVKAVLSTVVPLVYIGPNTKKLPQYAVYSNGLPKEAQEYIKQCPALAALFVPVSKLHEVQANIQDSASAESIFYAKAKEFLEGVK